MAKKTDKPDDALDYMAKHVGQSEVEAINAIVSEGFEKFGIPHKTSRNAFVNRHKSIIGNFEALRELRQKKTNAASDFTEDDQSNLDRLEKFFEPYKDLKLTPAEGDSPVPVLESANPTAVANTIIHQEIADTRTAFDASAEDSTALHYKNFFRADRWRWNQKNLWEKLRRIRTDTLTKLVAAFREPAEKDESEYVNKACRVFLDYYAAKERDIFNSAIDHRIDDIKKDSVFYHVRDELRSDMEAYLRTMTNYSGPGATENEKETFKNVRNELYRLATEEEPALKALLPGKELIIGSKQIAEELTNELKKCAAKKHCRLDNRLKNINLLSYCENRFLTLGDITIHRMHLREIAEQHIELFRDDSKKPGTIADTLLQAVEDRLEYVRTPEKQKDFKAQIGTRPVERQYSSGNGGRKIIPLDKDEQNARMGVGALGVGLLSISALTDDGSKTIRNKDGTAVNTKPSKGRIVFKVMTSAIGAMILADAVFLDGKYTRNIWNQFRNGGDGPFFSRF